MKITKSTDDDDLEDLRDGELFKIISRKDNLSNEAYDVFYNRYKRDFFNKVCKITSDEVLVNEVFQETMEFIYLNPSKFKAEDGLSKRAERGRTLNWLAVIAKNIYIEKFREQEKLPKIDSLDSDDQTDETKKIINNLSEYGFVNKATVNLINREIEDTALGIGTSANYEIALEKRILLDVLATYSERDIDILKAYLLEKDLNIKNQQFPRKILKELREKHNISSGYIRKLKERIFKRVEKDCKDAMAKIAQSKL